VFVFFEILIDVLLLPMHLNSQPLIVKNESSQSPTVFLDEILDICLRILIVPHIGREE
jgi:hypothetical protein